MKKLLSILGAMNLIWTASTNVIACDNNKIFQIDCSEIFGTKGEIRSLISDKNNYIYVGTATENFQGSIYKTNSHSNFVEMTGTTGSVDHLISDTNKNIYAWTEPDNFYTTTNDSIEFRKSNWPAGSLSFLTHDNKGQIWAGNSGGGVYYYSNQTWNEADVFSNFGKILSFKFNSFGIIYFINEKNEIYKFWGSEQDSKFIKLIDFNDRINYLLIDSNNNVYAISDNKIFKSDGNNNFIQVFSTENIILLAKTNNNNIYIKTIDNKLYKLLEENNKLIQVELKPKLNIQGNISCITFFKPYGYLNNLLYIGTDKGKVYYLNI